VKRFSANPYWALPSTAVMASLLLGAVAHWPPTRWTTVVAIFGAIPISAGSTFSIPVESWNGYFYSLWPGAFEALVAALSLLVVLHLFRRGGRRRSNHNDEAT